MTTPGSPTRLRGGLPGEIVWCSLGSCSVWPSGLLLLPEPLELLRPAGLQRDDLRGSIPYRRRALADEPEIVQPVHAVSPFVVC